jgi:SnoaL-like domain
MSTFAEDYAEISNLFARYCLTLDHEELDAWLDVFTPDGAFHSYGRQWTGPEELKNVMEFAPQGLHHGGPIVIEELDEDTARTRQNLYFVDRESGESRLTVYDDELRRVDGKWKIQVRLCRYLTPDGVSIRPAKNK